MALSEEFLTTEGTELTEKEIYVWSNSSLPSVVGKFFCSIELS